MQAVLLVAGPDLLDQIVERIVLAIVGGEDRYRAAPHQKRERRLHQLREIIDKGGFVQDDAPLFGTQGSGFGGQPPDVEAGGKADAVDRDVAVFVPQNDFLGFIRHHVEDFCPEGAVADEGLGHLFVIGEIKSVLPPGLAAFGGLHR